MTRPIGRRELLASVVGSSSLAFLRCGSSLEGIYADANGRVAIELRSGKAGIRMGAVMEQVEYDVLGDRILLRRNKNDQEPIILTRQDDGSLDTPFGRMTRRID